MAKSGGIFKKIIILLVLVALAFGGYWAYENIFKSNVHLNGKKFTYIYIKTNATFNDVLDELYSQNIIDDHESFEWMAKEMDLPEHINSGKYRIDAKMSNRSIAKMIIKGKQEKVKLSFNSQIRTKEQFIDYVSDKLEIENAELEDYCSNEDILTDEYGLNSENFMALIVPETYEVNWTTHINDLFVLLEKSYDEVWTKAKKDKAKSLGYSIPELITIASIVQSESSIKTEQQKIAGVYINRLKQDMKLQADPTVVFANGNFDVQRVLSADKDIDSPYNTYRYKGLPPGPICLVNPSTIDAVLNYSKHNYTYFCAKADFSGYSNFTNDYKVHMKNAAAYQEALNKKGIKR
ncbi:MAG: endolytic transglycosylase MltG [Bacteroidia bacterium]|nr:endolytic transglycosylase MltG [Bacteroidia bacterium]